MSTGRAVSLTVYGGLLREELAFFRAVNSALSKGLVPERAELSAVYPKGTPEEAVKASREAFGSAALSENIAVSGESVSFSEKQHISAFTVAISGRFEGTYGTPEAPKALPGQALLLTRFPGDTGAMLFLQERREFLSGIFSSSFLRPVSDNREQLSSSKDAAIFRRHGAAMQDVSEGGILRALWEFSKNAGCGFSVDLTGIPMHQETIEIAEALGLDPYALYSSGCMLAAVSDGNAVLRELHASGIPAERIGVIRGDKKKLLLHDEEERHLDRPKPDPVFTLENFG